MQLKLEQDLENLKRLSLRWMIRKGISLPEAEDVFQQSILKALTHSDSLKDSEKLQSWFMTLLKNTLFDQIRTKKLHDEKNKIYEIERALLHEEEEIEASFGKCVTGFMHDLPADEQELIQKHFLEGKTFVELAKESTQTVGNLRVKSLRAREKLKTMFQACCNVRKFNDLEDCKC